MNRVIVYSTPTCSYCVMAKKYLQEQGIEFEEKDVSKDTQAAAEMVQKSGQQGVPVIEINGEILIGFNKQDIDWLLNITM